MAGCVATGNANPVCRADTGSCEPSGQYFAALPTPAAPSTSSSITLPEVTVYAPYSCHGLGPRVSSCGTIRNEHYEVPLDFEANVAMHPYTSGMGPWPGPGTWGIIDKPPRTTIDGPGFPNTALPVVNRAIAPCHERSKFLLAARVRRRRVAGPYNRGDHSILYFPQVLPLDLLANAPLRPLRSRTPDRATVQRAVGKGVTSCPRAGCGKSACPVR